MDRRQRSTRRKTVANIPWEDSIGEEEDPPSDEDKKRIKLARALGLDYVPCGWERYAWGVNDGSFCKIKEVYDEYELDRLWLVVEELANRLGIRGEESP